MSRNRFIDYENYLSDVSVSKFSPRLNRKTFSGPQWKKSKCKQVSEAPVASDEFVLDILEFFFNERLTPEMLNNELRQVAATATYKATYGSNAMDYVPRPPKGVPSFTWLVSEAVQMAIRKAQNQCIYETVRVTVKASMRSEYELAKTMATSQSYFSGAFENSLSTSDQGVEFIKRKEAFRGNLYNDPAGHCTIGYGHLVHRGNCNGSEPDEFKSGITEQRATELLQQHLTTIESAINAEVTAALSQHQFDALVSFIYNIGAQAFRQSTLLRLLNKGNYAMVPVELKKWIFSSGQKLDGLVKRREAEANLFVKGVY